jgi:hypothetical protein
MEECDAAARFFRSSCPRRRRCGEISVEFTILPFQDSSGALLGIAASLRDVTARFEETRALRRELAALRGAGERP